MTDDKATTPNPFSRPGFIAGAVVVVALVLGAGFLTVLNLTRGDDATPDPLASASIGADPAPAADGGGASVCGLDGVKLSGTVTTPPPAEWGYQGTVAYPTSPTFGPGATGPEGYPYCFQHSPEGALFATATALATPSNPDLASAWIQYALSDGEYRSSLLTTATPSSDSTGARLQLVGFRVLSYDGETARIDLAARISTQGQTVTGSYVYSLIWEDGDWKIDARTPTPFDFSSIPDTSGYISWRA